MKKISFLFLLLVLFAMELATQDKSGNDSKIKMSFGAGMAYSVDYGKSGYELSFNSLFMLKDFLDIGAGLDVFPEPHYKMTTFYNLNAYLSINAPINKKLTLSPGFGFFNYFPYDGELPVGLLAQIRLEYHAAKNLYVGIEAKHPRFFGQKKQYNSLLLLNLYYSFRM